MSRQIPFLGLILLGAAIQSGCQPQQPVYLFEDGDLSHYKDVATEIEYPDLQSAPNPEAEGATPPFSVANQEITEEMVKDITLEEAMRIALANSKVMRNIGGQIIGPPDFLARNPELAPSIYDPAIVESGVLGPEAALALFDAQLASTATWSRVDQPLNRVPVSFGPQQLFVQAQQNYQASFTNSLYKVNATGGWVSISHDIVNTTSNSEPLRIYHGDWTTMLRAQITQPLLQGAGVQFNRIVGPQGRAAGGGFARSPQIGVYNGVMIARIRTDIALANFEEAVRNLVNDVEVAYWELYYFYRALDTTKRGRDSALRTWQEIHERLVVGTVPIHEEAQARQQYFIFKTAMERALTAVFQAEAKLRYMMGLATSDGRLLRPKDEPTTAKVKFDWSEVLPESMARNSELREQRWLVKQRELELIAAKNYLLPALDLVAMYQWQGMGELLLEPNGGTGDYRVPGSNAYQSMTHGDFQNWTVGAVLNVPIGFRKEMANVRNGQLSLARERARLQEAELEVSHQLAYALRDLESNLLLSQSNFNRRIAGDDEVRSAWARYKAGVGRRPGGMGAGAMGGAGEGGTLADVLDAQRRLAEAEADYYRALVDYNKAIAQVHFRKGSLLEYNGVYLAEGPWPAKAYFDACRRARARDAGLYIDYGFTQPKVISRGPIDQRAGQPVMIPGEGVPGEPTGAVRPEALAPEAVPAPQPHPSSPQPAPPVPQPDETPKGTTAVFRQPSLAGAPSAPKATDSAGKTSDRGSAELGSAARRSNWQSATVTVKPAAYAEPDQPAQTEKAKQNDARAPGEAKRSSRLRWADSSRSVTADEPVAHPPPAETDRPAASGKRLER